MDDDGPPQPQLTIVVNSTHHLVSGETDSQFHTGMGVDANDADDELDGPRVHGNGRHNNVGGRGAGRHHGHQRHILPHAGPATSATRAGGAHINGAMASSRSALLVASAGEIELCLLSTVVVGQMVSSHHRQYFRVKLFEALLLVVLVDVFSLCLIQILFFSFLQSVALLRSMFSCQLCGTGQNRTGSALLPKTNKGLIHCVAHYYDNIKHHLRLGQRTLLSGERSRYGSITHVNSKT